MLQLLFVLLVVGWIVWLIAPKLFSTHVQAPDKLNGPELEDAIVDLKGQIFQTSAYESEAKYIRLHERLTSLIQEVLDRHRHFVLDVEARPGGVPVGMVYVQSETYDRNGISRPTRSVNPSVGPPFVENDVLLYLCFFLYLGGRPSGSPEVEEDPRLMLKILDRLIEQDSYAPAIFFKGLVLKYGQKVYARPRIREARALLERAASLGVGAATIELQNINKYLHLEGMDTVHGE